MQTQSDPTALPDGWSPGCERILLDVATRAIETRLAGDERATVDHGDLPPCLLARRTCFVTLRARDSGALRGCIGSLEVRETLVDSVWRNARQAAFADPRFEPVHEAEWPQLDIHISVLSPMTPFEVEDEADCLSRLRPGMDGLVLEEGVHRATFLPAVWESLDSPEAFLSELKRKAGLPLDHWSGDVRLWRYTAYSIPD